ncbi:FtsX-like permease family protein [Pseudopelagicola sp. nBUS_20]|uniref:ABC transporter permease n=1 Tax=Pseudopelagicola sp. nBUS_20 TaxID=3395317 RepID=UPI003EC0BA81
MTWAGLVALWSHWVRHPLQLLTLVAGLALATGLWSAVQAVNAEARASYDAAATTLGEGRFDALLPSVGETIPMKRFLELRRVGWQVSPILEGKIDTGEEQVRVVGLEPLTSPRGFEQFSSIKTYDLVDVLSGRIVFVGPNTADLVKGSIDALIIEDLNISPKTVVADISVVQSLLNQPNSLTRLVLSEAQPLGRPALAAIAPDLVLMKAADGNEIGRLTDSFHLNLTAFGLLSFAVGIFIVHGAIGLAVEQRRGMVRTMRAVGMSLNRIILLLTLELTMLALVGGVLGILLGYFVAASLLPGVAATLEGLYGAEVTGGNLQLRPVWWLSGLAMALVGTLLAATDALWRIRRMPILSRGGARAWSMAAVRGRRVQALMAVGLLGASGMLAVVDGGLITGFVLLACLLLGAALALPLSLGFILKIAQHSARQVVWEWFWADTRQQLPGLSLALMALLLAMAANVGVSTMVSSFRLTFVGFLDQRLASDIYVTTNSIEQAAQLEKYLIPRSSAVLPLLSIGTRLAGQPAELFGARVGPTYTENWRFLAFTQDAWSQVGAGSAVIVNEQLARRAELWVGDSLAIAPGKVLPIVGVFGDYGNPIGQAIVSEGMFHQLFPNRHATRFGIRSDNPQGLINVLTDSFGLPARNIIDQAAIKAISMQVFDRTFIVTGALNVLTLAVAAFAILTSLLTLAAMRIPQLAPVWALGLTRREVGLLEVVRAIVLAGLTGLFALPLGLALAWVLLAIVNVDAFGWRLPMYFFPADYLRLGLFALIASIVAALWPAFQLIRIPPTQLLKVFANVR